LATVLNFFPFLVGSFCSIKENTLKLKHKNLPALAHKMHFKNVFRFFPFFCLEYSQFSDALAKKRRMNAQTESPKLLPPFVGSMGLCLFSYRYPIKGRGNNF